MRNYEQDKITKVLKKQEYVSCVELDYNVSSSKTRIV